MFMTCNIKYNVVHKRDRCWVGLGLREKIMEMVLFAIIIQANCLPNAKKFISQCSKSVKLLRIGLR